MKLLFIGDIFGHAGRSIVADHLADIRKTQAIDVVIANGENSAAGFGITPAVADELFRCGIDVMTSGNHIWDKRDIYEYFDAQSASAAAGELSAGLPRRGHLHSRDPSGARCAVINLQGRVYMAHTDCPFRKADELLAALPADVKVRFIDFHAEVTSEKMAMGWYVDGRVSAVVGTHTHIPTADTRILPGGTAYQTDCGMTGPYDSVIGVEKDAVLQKFLTAMPVRMEASQGLGGTAFGNCRSRRPDGQSRQHPAAHCAGRTDSFLLDVDDHGAPDAAAAAGNRIPAALFWIATTCVGLVGVVITVSGINTLICHTPTSVGARPEYWMFAAGTKSVPMINSGACGVCSGAFEILPSGGAPGMNPWPVPNRVITRPLHRGIVLAVHRIVLIEGRRRANAVPGLREESRQDRRHCNRRISKHAARRGLEHLNVRRSALRRSHRHLEVDLIGAGVEQRHGRAVEQHLHSIQLFGQRQRGGFRRLAAELIVLASRKHGR